MNKSVKLVLFGILIWFIPFLVSLVIFPLKSSFNLLFESIMPVVLSATVVAVTYYYLKGVEENQLKEGATAGILWLAISLAIDLALFQSVSPMQMSLTNYMMDIGITYLMIPIITSGMGLAVKKPL